MASFAFSKNWSLALLALEVMNSLKPHPQQHLKHRVNGVTQSTEIIFFD